MPDPEDRSEARTAAKPGERDREAARVLVEAAKLKWLSDQRKLLWHEYVIEIVAESSVAARHEGDAAGYARGLEEAASIADNSKFGTPTSVAWATTIAAAIRSLAAAAVLEQPRRDSEREKPDGEDGNDG